MRALIDLSYPSRFNNSVEFLPRSFQIEASCFDAPIWQVSTGSVWYHEEKNEAPKLKHLEVLYLSNNALAAIPEEIGNLQSLKVTSLQSLKVKIGGS